MIPFVQNSDDELKATLELVEQHGKAEAARMLGLSRRAVEHRLANATSRNLTQDYLGGVAPVGTRIGKVTRHVMEDGRVKEEWQRFFPDADAMEELYDEIVQRMAQDIKPADPYTVPDLVLNPDRLALYPIVDVHLGQYSWAKESGENYDLDIAKAQFIDAYDELAGMVASTNAGEALIVVLGDFFHADNNDAVTHRSGNHLDVDGRHDKVLHLGVELLIRTIETAKRMHNHVTVHVTRGNHDPYASKTLATALFFRYQGDPRVTIDRSPKDLWTFQWGATMLGFTHGDNVKAEHMPGVMAAQDAVMWGNTKYRYGYSGHYHKSKKGQPGEPKTDEKYGAIYEILPAFTAKDAWNAAMGHTSQRSVVAKVFDMNRGLKHQPQVQI